MITLYHIVTSDEQDSPSGRSRRGPDFWTWREMRRYEYGAVKFREAGMIAHAELFEKFAEQARLEMAALEEVDTRIAALDRTLKGGAA